MIIRNLILNCIIIFSIYHCMGCSSVKDNCDSIAKIESIQKNEQLKLFGNKVPNFLNPDTIKWTYDNREIFFNNSLGPIIKSKNGKSEVLELINELNPPTIYQDIQTDYILHNILNQIISTNNKVEIFQNGFDYIFTTVYSNQINAESKKICNNYVIFFDSQLYNFCLVMTKIAIKSIITENLFNGKSDSLLTDIKTNRALQERFVVAVLEFLYPSKYSTDDLYEESIKLDPKNQSIAFHLLNSMEIFVMSHELTHAEFDHDSKKEFQNYNSEFLDSNMEKRLLIKNWENELLADLYAQNLLNNFADLENHIYFRDFQKIGSVFYFKCAEILDKCSFILNNKMEKNDINKIDSLAQMKILSNLFKNKSQTNIDFELIDNSWLSKTHPPDQLRIELVNEEIYENISKTGGNKEQKYFYKLGLSLINIIENLFEETKQKLIKLSNLDEFLNNNK